MPLKRVNFVQIGKCQKKLHKGGCTVKFADFYLHLLIFKTIFPDLQINYYLFLLVYQNLWPWNIKNHLLFTDFKYSTIKMFFYQIYLVSVKNCKTISLVKKNIHNFVQQFRHPSCFAKIACTRKKIHSACLKSNNNRS